jgi:hypothetical protein
MPPKKKSKIERLKERLYSPKSKNIEAKPRAEIYEDPHAVPGNWTKEPMVTHKKKKNLLHNTMFRRFFITAILFFVVSVGFGMFMFFGGSNTVSADNIDIVILGNAFVSGGEELPLEIQLVNRNNVPLEYGDLIIEYQKGSGGGEEIQSDRVTVGTIPAGGMVEKLVNVTIFGQQGTTRDLNITLEYRVKGSSAIFVKQKPYVVNISSTPVNLLIEGPEVTNSNQEITFDITASLNTESSVKDMMIVVNYPPGFDLEETIPEATFSNNIWSLGDLQKGAEKKITITGVVVADADEERAFNVYIGSADPENEQRIGTQFNSESYIVSIEKPFLDLEFRVAGNPATEVSLSGTQMAEGEIELTNTLDTKMTDIEVVAKFSGNAFDPNRVTTSDGFYDSTKQTIVWNSQTTDALQSFDPGDDHELRFNFRPAAFGGQAVRNPEINIEISVKGRQPSLGNLFREIDNYVKKKIKYGSSLQITGNALYTSGPFVNSGPLPPTPGSPTTYTIVWNLANGNNKIVDAKASTTLPVYVEWLGKVSPNSQSLIYNTNTRELVWDIGTLEPFVGTNTSARQVYFQVRLNPSGSQSGTTVNLTSETSLRGKDSFTSADINRSLQPVSTRLNLDSNYNPENDKVE